MLLLTVDVCVCAAKPRAKGMHRSVNLVEGDELKLTCEPWGWPVPTVEWKRESGPLNFSDPRILVSADNNSLTIESVELDDRDHYLCMLTSHINETMVLEGNKTTLVRVKGAF